MSAVMATASNFGAGLSLAQCLNPTSSVTFSELVLLNTVVDGNVGMRCTPFCAAVLRRSLHVLCLGRGVWLRWRCCSVKLRGDVDGWWPRGQYAVPRQRIRLEQPDGWCDPLLQPCMLWIYTGGVLHVVQAGSTFRWRATHSFKGRTCAWWAIKVRSEGFDSTRTHMALHAD